MTRDYDSTVARMAGNIAAGLVLLDAYADGRGLKKQAIASAALEIAQRIVDGARAAHAAVARPGDPT